MTSISIAYNNVKYNLKLYWLHLTALIFSVMTYYLFIVMKNNPEVLQISAIQEIKTLGYLTSIVLLIFIVFFSWFSSSFFLTQRKKEIGLYCLMGVTNYRVAYIYAIENLILYIIAITFGCGLGSLLGKLFMMVLSRYCNLGVTIDFFISFESLIETIIIFGIIGLLTSLKGYFEIIRSNLLQLMNAVKKEEEMPKSSIFIGALSLIIIGTGYFISTLATESSNFLVTTLVTVALVIIGTYMIFKSTITILLKRMINNKSILYKKSNIITLSSLCYRIRRNYKVYATLAVLLSATITSFSTFTSIKYSYDNMEQTDYPFTFLHVTSNPEDHDIVNNFINENGSKILFQNNFEFILYEEAVLHKHTFPYLAVMRYVDFERVINNLEYKYSHKVLLKKPLENGQSLFNRKSSTIFSLGQNSIGILDGVNIDIIKSVKAPLFGRAFGVDALIVNDETYFQLARDRDKYMYYGYKMEDEKEFQDNLMDQLKAQIPNKISTKQISYFSSSAETMVKDQLYLVIKMLYILGAFLAIVFVMATGSIIYFKIINDAIEDKEKYDILQKLGMSKDEAKKAISIQIAIAFIAPLAVAIIHSFVAIQVLEEIIGIVLLAPTIFSIVIISLLFFIYYILTKKEYLRIICL